MKTAKNMYGLMHKNTPKIVMSIVKDNLNKDTTNLYNGTAEFDYKYVYIYIYVYICRAGINKYLHP